MSDPNLQQSDTQPPRRTRKKKLPPLTNEQAAESTTQGDDDQGIAAARPRRKKRVPRQQAEQESPDHLAGPTSSDQQLIESGNADPAKPRRKKRKPRRPQADGEQLEDERRSPEGQEEGQAGNASDQAVPARPRHIDVEGMPLAKVLESVRDDVVTKNEGRVNHGADFQDEDGVQEEDIEDDPLRLAGQAGGDNNVSDTIFRQTQDARAFKAEKIEKYQQRVDQERREREQYLQGVQEEDTSNRTLKCAIGFTKVYNYIGTLLIGAIPGFALLHTAYSWLLGSDYFTFLQSYSSLSQPIPIMMYVLLTLILLSVFDRYDTGKLDSKSCLECVSFRHAGMVVLLFLPSYLVSNAMYPTDLWIREFQNNRTAYIGLTDGNSIVQSWRIMDAVRTGLLVLGWVVVAFNTSFNKLAINLESELDDLIGEEQVELAPKTEAA